MAWPRSPNDWSCGLTTAGEGPPPLRAGRWRDALTDGTRGLRSPHEIPNAADKFSTKTISMCEHVKNPTQLCFAPVRGRLPFDKQGRCLSTFGPRRLGTDVVKNAQPESSLMRDPRLKHRSTRVHSLSWMEYQERNDLCNGSRSVITSAWSADVITERTCAERWRSAWP